MPPATSPRPTGRSLTVASRRQSPGCASPPLQCGGRRGRCTCRGRRTRRPARPGRRGRRGSGPECPRRAPGHRRQAWYRSGWPGSAGTAAVPRTPASAAAARECGHALVLQPGRVRVDRVPGVAVPQQPPDRHAARPADPDRRVRTAYRSRSGVDPAVRREVAVGGGDIAGPQLHDRGQVLVGDRAPALERHAERGVLLLRPARPHAEHEPAAAEPVEVRGDPCGLQRVAVGQHGDRAAQLEPVRVGGQPRDRGERRRRTAPGTAPGPRESPRRGRRSSRSRTRTARRTGPTRAAPPASCPGRS